MKATKRFKDVESKLLIELPRMSWEVPIEEELLRHVRFMKLSWRRHVSIWPSVNEAAKVYADAYETIEERIMQEIERRKKAPHEKS